MSKVMLVEDDNNLREIYEARLQAEGYTIVSAKDGEEALVVAKAEKPDLIISDVMMPKISGFEMLDILRNTPELRDVRVVMLTALGQTEDQSRASHLGADRYLVKSQVTLEDIVKVTHELLGDLPQEEAPTEAEPAQVETSPPPVAVAQEIAVNPAPPVEQPVAPAPVVEAPEPMQPAMPNDPTPVEETPVESTATNEQMESPSDEISIDASGQFAQSEPGSNALSQPDPMGVTLPADNSEATLAANQAANVETLTQAVNDLSNESTQAPTEAAASESNDSNAVVEDSSVPDYSPASSVSGKKIIKPLDQQPQHSLDELLAIEEASQTPDQATAPQAVGTDPKTPFDPSDPNNIAL